MSDFVCGVVICGASALTMVLVFITVKLHAMTLSVKILQVAAAIAVTLSTAALSVYYYMEVGLTGIMIVNFITLSVIALIIRSAVRSRREATGSLPVARSYGRG